MSGGVVVKHTLWFDRLILNHRWLFRALTVYRGLSRLILNVEVLLCRVLGLRWPSREEFSVSYRHLDVFIHFFRFRKSSDRRWSSGSMHLSLLLEEGVLSSSNSNYLLLELVGDFGKHSVLWRCLLMKLEGSRNNLFILLIIRCHILW